MTPEFVAHFAVEWVAAWNSHDLTRILQHYTDDFEMSSPKIIEIADEPSGTLTGKPKVSAYWARALERIPDLHFELLASLCGVNTAVLYYRGAGGRLAAEVFFFNAEGKVYKACANYED